MPLTAATDRMPECSLASSRPLRVSLVNLQKLTFHACDDWASIRMLAPAQNIFSRPPVITTALTPGCSKRTRWIASYSSMSTPRS